jgi:sulfatase modifying factor 1
MKNILIILLLVLLILLLTFFSFNPQAKTIISDLGIEFVFVPAGEFLMGSESGYDREKPVHRVYLDSYYIAKTEITFAQYNAFCKDSGINQPDEHLLGRADRPVNYVSRNDAIAFCDWLSKKTGENICLPSEVQWEKACRATSTGDYYANLDSCAWYKGNSRGGMRPVARKQSNAYGLYDMLGNVFEWCSDWYDFNYYKKSPLRNPPGPVDGRFGVVRGGGWSSTAHDCRASYRTSYLPTFRSYLLGFRIVKSS